MDSVINKTRKYLYPCLQLHGKAFLTALKSLKDFKGAFIHDDDHGYEYDYPVIYILVDLTRVKKSGEILETLDTIRKLPQWVTDYPFGDQLLGTFHMFVFTIPDRMHGSYIEFLKGKYSNMYDFLDEEELSKLFMPIIIPPTITNAKIRKDLNLKNKLVVDAYQRLTKLPKKKEEFEDEIGCNLPENAELDYQLRPSQEIVNFSGEINNVFIQKYIKYEKL